MVKRFEIEKVVYRGKGLARHEGKVVFIPGVLEGEAVDAEIVLEKKKYAKVLNNTISIYKILKTSI